MTIKKMWLFTIAGEDEIDIHGKRYRVEIRKFARKTPGLCGSVRNIKGLPEIEVRLAMEDEVKASSFRVELERFVNAHKEGRERFVFSGLRSFQEDDGKYQDFTVMREDELTEMVWALQGAGDVFLSSSEKIRELMVNRDYRKERGLLGALKLEIGFVNEQIGEMIADIVTGKPPGKFEFQQDCLRKALVEPAWADNDNFLQLTSDLFHIINQEDRPSSGYVTPEEQLKDLESLNKVSSEYYNMIDTRIEELDGKIDSTHTDISEG